MSEGAYTPQTRVRGKEILLSNDSVIKPIASEYAGAAGSNHGLCGMDELWAYTSERSRRLYEELTPVPTRMNSIRLITTYAGFENESKLLRDLYIQAVDCDEHQDGKGERLHPDLPIYGNREARIFAYWDHQPRFGWQTPAYYASQKQSLRPSAFLRFHQNRWSTSEEVFITPELWDPCIDHTHRPMLPTQEYPIFLGVDGAIKHDSAAIVGVRWDGNQLALAYHRIWQPTPEEPLDLEVTIEAELRSLHQHYKIQTIVYDPYQLHRSMSGLHNEGLPCEEYPQTSGNCTAMGQALFDLLTGKNIRIYASDELRTQALNTISVESTRGWKISKDKSSKKIDAIVALAMAAVAALDEGNAQAVDVSPDEILRIQRAAGLIPGYVPDRPSYQETQVTWEDWPDA